VFAGLEFRRVLVRSRELGDSAGDPRFIEAVPKHGYRFIAQVVADGVADAPAAAPAAALASPAQGWTWQQSLLLAAAGTAGAGVAGLLGGLAYGFAGAS